MRVSPHKFLTVALVGSLAIVFVRCPSDPIEPPSPQYVDPEAEALAAGVPEIVPLRLIAKDLITQDVIAGRRSIWEAAALFRELNRLPPEPAKPSLFDPSLSIPADTEEEWLCRDVAVRVSAELCDEPERASAITGRLEAEFFAETFQHGAIRLPEPSSLTPVSELLEQARRRLTDARRQSDRGANGRTFEPRSIGSVLP